MEFPGTWINQSGTMVYRVIPKCACSTIGQLLYYSDHGRFFEGDVHDCVAGVWKWNNNPDLATARSRIVAAATGGKALTFTCVRNPYTRILSAFFDKICGTQRNGQKYRGDMVAKITRGYAMDLAGDFDQIAAFRRFLLFARDTIKYRRPIDPDIHWAPMANHASTLVRNGGRYDIIFASEDFAAGMEAVLERAAPVHRIACAQVPRFNESHSVGPAQAHPVEAFFDDFANDLMLDIYRRDFAVFKYRRQPNATGPKTALDPEEINARLAD
ncbi:MAG: sulfotransferase family protein [Pseudomonadota bacterium]